MTAIVKRLVPLSEMATVYAMFQIGMDTIEIARRLECTEAAAYNALLRMRAKMRHAA